MAPLPGLTGVSKAPQQTDEGVLEAHGGPIDPSHSEYGDMYGDTWPSGYGTGYHGTAYPSEVDKGDYPEFDQHGNAYDKTPTTHDSPYPTGLIQPNLEDSNSYASTAIELARQRHELHGSDLGAVTFYNRNAPGGRQTPSNITVDRYDSPNISVLSTGLPGQLRQGNNGVGRDVAQGYGQLNSTDEFQHGHSIRIIDHDGLAWDRSLDYAPPQPLYPRYPQQQASFDVDSPYGEVLGDTSTGQQVVWEGRIGNPTAYQAPPEPTVVQPAMSSPADDGWAYYG